MDEIINVYEKKFVKDSRKCKVTIYEKTDKPAPLVYINSYDEKAETLLEMCEELETRDFNLVALTEMDWDSVLSPWPEATNIVGEGDNFEGMADDYLNFILKIVVPFAEEKIQGQITESILVGYSLAGLFSLYAMYQTQIFKKIASISGSVWYPRFIDYVRKNRHFNSPEAIYLSIGDKESKTKNNYLKTTEFITRELYNLYSGIGIDCEFELNPGSHFTDPEERIAKGIKWILK